MIFEFNDTKNIPNLGDIVWKQGVHFLGLGWFDLFHQGSRRKRMYLERKTISADLTTEYTYS